MKYKICPKCKAELYPMVEIDQVIGSFCPECDFEVQTHTVQGRLGEHYSVPLDDCYDDFPGEEDLLEVSSDVYIRENRILNLDDEMPF